MRRPPFRVARPAVRLLALALPLAVALPATLAAQPRRPVSNAPAPTPAAVAARVEAALKAQPVVDGHNDLPWAIREHTPAPGYPNVEAYDLRARAPGQTDLERLRRGRVGVQFWSVYIPGEPAAAEYARNGRVTGTPGYARLQLEELDVARRMIARYPDALALATRSADVAPALAAGRIASFLGMEGGHAIENSLGTLRTFYDLGARYMTLTHNVTLDWADAALDTRRHGGLTRFGEEVVREMNRLGMLVDLSHVSDGTMVDALRVSEAPVIFSHSSARAIGDVARNVPDSVLRLLPRNGGVVMVTFVPQFISPEVVRQDRELQQLATDLRRRFPDDSAARERETGAWRTAHPRPRATLAQVADHLDHIKRVAGVDHVGIGGDFDGITETIVGLEDVSKYPDLFAELSRRGWSEPELRKLAGENVLRALARAEAVAARLRRERPASTKTIRELDGTVRQ
jgi:membrane dipeptidase